MRTRRAGVSPLFLLLVAVTAAGGVLTMLESATAVTAGVVLLVLGGWAVSLCLHEFGHAAVAYRSGDYSVRDKGYLTLDIRRYTDPVLSFVLPLIFLLVGGIPLPGGAVWINRAAVRSRVAVSLISLAGPLANLVLGVVLVAATRALQPPFWLAAGLSFLAFVQVIAFVLNVLPVPGLDGFGALEPYLSPETQRLAATVRPWAPLVLFLVIIGLPGVNRLFFEAADAVFQAFGGEPSAWVYGLRRFLFWQR